MTHDVDLWPFDPKINGYPGLILEHFCVKFGDPSCIGVWDVEQKKTDRHADKQKWKPYLPRLPSEWVTRHLLKNLLRHRVHTNFHVTKPYCNTPLTMLRPSDMMAMALQTMLGTVIRSSSWPFLAFQRRMSWAEQVATNSLQPLCRARNQSRNQFGTAVSPLPDQRCGTVCLNSFGNQTSPSDNLNDRLKRLCLGSRAAAPWGRRLKIFFLTHLLTYLHAHQIWSL